MNTLARLQQWYAAQCDGHWEHAYGVKIDTLDNPGWSVTIDVEGTPLEGRPFEKVEIDRSDADWIDCRVEKGRFQGAGGAGNLDELLTVFLDWASR
jgi:hypothetical protein